MLSDFGTFCDMMQTPSTRSCSMDQFPQVLCAQFLADIIPLVSNTPLQNHSPSHRTTPSLQQIQSQICGLGVILHRLILFHLPYCWAAYGHCLELYSSNTISTNEYDNSKGNNMDQLEWEVFSACESTCTSSTSILMMPLGIQCRYLGEGPQECSVGGLSEWFLRMHVLTDIEFLDRSLNNVRHRWHAALHEPLYMVHTRIMTPIYSLSTSTTSRMILHHNTFDLSV